MEISADFEPGPLEPEVQRKIHTQRTWFALHDQKSNSSIQSLIGSKSKDTSLSVFSHMQQSTGNRSLGFNSLFLFFFCKFEFKLKFPCLF